MKNVDIIVPVYNAYEYTEECIKSVLKNTDLNKHRLILINDKSPDEKIMPMLQKYVSENEDKQIVVLENEENSGFVKTVNRGMCYSKNDVILLNSDTEVTNNWLEKMITCAYSNDYIATATALTNNGTIASVPNFGVDNDLPKNMTLEQYAKMIEDISLKRYPELTTGNGFCMYIKRNVIEEIGLFDDITFEKGYGEENDFCYRALDHGYTNVLCDDTFIYHKGTQSFKKENLTKTRAAIIDDHMKKLRAKYPIYTTKTDQFLALNPIKDISKNVLLNTLIYKKRKVLFLVNEWEENMEMTGGTSLHLKDIILGIKENTACFVLAPFKYDLNTFKLYLYSGEYGKEIASFKTDINLYGQITYTNDSYKEMIKTIFDSFHIELLHVHHFLFQTFDAIDIAKERNVYSIITLHDLYMSCPSINMVYEEKFCEVNKNRNCEKCLKNRYGVESDILQNWRTTCKKVLEKFDKIIVPSQNTKEQFEKIYKDLKIEVIEHGVNLIKIDNKKETKRNEDVFNVSFVGAMAPHKGSRILTELIKKNKDNAIKIHLIGKSEDKNLNKNTSNYINHGAYRRGELPKLLVENNIDLVCIFATWPETYSYTLTETYMAKVPVLTFDIGAVGDRVKKDKLGWVIPFDEKVDKILEKIQDIRNNRKEYNKIKNNFENYKYKTTEQMQEEYKKMYEKVEIKNNLVDIKSIQQLENKSKEMDFNHYQAMYGHVVYRYERIRASKIWKLAKKVKRKLLNK